LGEFILTASGRIAQTTRDPLFARVLVLENGQSRAAIVSLDLVGPFPPEIFDPYRERLKREVGIDHVVLNASHTHNSPETETNLTEFRSWSWTSQAVDKIYRAILEAHRRAAPVFVGFEYSESTIGTNRRLITSQGVKTLWRNYPNKGTNEPIDRRVGVLRLDRLDKTPLALVVHYSCHPVALMSEASTEFSADYVGEMAREVGSQFTGHPEVLFWQGAAGDINLRDSISGSGELEVKRNGHELAEAVLGAARRIQTEREDRLSYGFETLEIPSRWSEEVIPDLRQRGVAIDRWFEKNYQQKYSAPIRTLLIEKKLALVFLPGEPFIDYQFQLDYKSPISNTLLVGYCERGFGYLPTLRAAAEGGYGGNGPENTTCRRRRRSHGRARRHSALYANRSSALHAGPISSRGDACALMQRVGCGSSIEV
jgi:hypothetical protein